MERRNSSSNKFFQFKKQTFSKLRNFFFGADNIGPLHSGILHRINKELDINSLSNFLAYDLYDPETQIFYMQKAKGCLLIAEPLSGAGPAEEENLYSLLQSALPEGTIVHFLLFGNPRVGNMLDRYAYARKDAHPLLRKNAQMRTDFLKQGVYKSLVPQQECVIRNFKLFISLVFDEELHLSEEQIIQYRDDLKGILTGMQMAHTVANADDLVEISDELLHPTDDIYPSTKSWNPLENISMQIAKGKYNYKADNNRIEINDDWQIITFSVDQFPKHLEHLGIMHCLTGDLFKDVDRIGSPFALSLIVEILPDKLS